MKVKVKDFLSKWSGNFTIENESGAIYGEFRVNLTEELLNKDIVDIKLHSSMWTGKNGSISIIVE